jgi:hypothetical protein
VNNPLTHQGLLIPFEWAVGPLRPEPFSLGTMITTVRLCGFCDELLSQVWDNCTDVICDERTGAADDLWSPAAVACA